MCTGSSDEAVGYGIAGGNLGNVFGVDPESGRIFVNQKIDFETTPRFELWVKTFYTTKPLFFAAKKIVIEVKDRHDNPPEFENQFVKVTFFRRHFKLCNYVITHETDEAKAVLKNE